MNVSLNFFLSKSRFTPFLCQGLQWFRSHDSPKNTNIQAVRYKYE